MAQSRDVANASMSGRRTRKDDDEYIDIDDAIDTHENEDAQGGGYSWEEEYKRSWDVLQEDSEGRLSSVVAQLQQQMKRRRLLRDTATVQRGIIRHFFLVIDLSEAMNEKDLRPSRLELTLTYAKQFVMEYFDQNPISQLGIIVIRDGIAERLTDLSGNPTDHLRALKNKRNQETSGEPSLQNALDMACASLVNVPSHGSREVLVIYGSLTTCDPGDIYDTIATLKKENVRVSFVGLAAEIQVCRKLCKETNGKTEKTNHIVNGARSYGVVLNEAHFKDLLFEAIPPPAVTQTRNTSNLVMMGFPTKSNDLHPSFCVCHSKLTVGGYICPRCSSKICELPTDCDVCGLTLVSSPHLARSYHHLFPVDNFLEVPWSGAKSINCFACQTAFDSSPMAGAGLESNSGRYSCPRCFNHFCVDCDIFVHEVLHNCPGCWAAGSNISAVKIDSSSKISDNVQPMEGVQVAS
ncbi:hypothetical protein INT43_004997 [Umbelopsis isabellina]|uniref:General transcription and DNA repair factor IIH n=1 Tax=Mortierella isabellina TaxID=91625 RepID=A0A8H7PGK2_MORIS|nr:hypothetical protein INT43_004997 [Umbelopsis isabellina]